MHSDKSQSENNIDLLEKLLNDRILSRFIATVGYSTLAKVQDLIQYSNQVFKHTGQKMPLSNLLTARAQLAPAHVVKTRRGFRA